MFTDFSGDGRMITDPETGQTWEAQLFVAVLGASGYTYAELFNSQQLPCWIDGHIHAFECFQGVAEITVPDNTKTAVKHPCNYEPDLNPTFLELARHYGTVVIPARIRKPRDKAKVENAVLIAQRWILAACRWIAQHENLLITGPTGIGKTWLACAFAQNACRDGFSAFYIRLPRLFQAFQLARGDGSYNPKPIPLLLPLASMIPSRSFLPSKMTSASFPLPSGRTEETQVAWPFVFRDPFVRIQAMPALPALSPGSGTSLNAAPLSLNSHHSQRTTICRVF